MTVRTVATANEAASDYSGMVLNTITILIHYLLTTWGRFLLEKLTGGSASQEIPLIFTEPMGSLPCLQQPSHIPILSQINPVHVPSHFLEIHLNINLPSTHGSSLNFPHQNPVCNSQLPTRATCSAHLVTVDSITE
jgi:hypothetical protein